MRFLRDCQIRAKILDQLAQPQAVTSHLQLGKLTKQTDDMVGRLLEDMETDFGKVAVFDNHRLRLTDRGRELRLLIEGLKNFAECAEVPPEMLVVEAQGGLMDGLAPRVLPALIETWGSAIQFQTVPLTHSPRKNISEGGSAMAIAIADPDETVPSGEILGPKVQWTACVRNGHRLSGSRSLDSAEQLEPVDRIFIPGSMVSHPSLEAFLRRFPRTSVVECESCLWMVVSADLRGIGLLPDVLGDIQGMQKLAVGGTEPVQVRLFPPRQVSAMSQAVQSLVELLRAAMQPKQAERVGDSGDATKEDGATNGELGGATNEDGNELEKSS